MFGCWFGKKCRFHSSHHTSQQLGPDSVPKDEKRLRRISSGKPATLLHFISSLIKAS
ncbi:hypothetical protein BC830DRAFT_1142164 [Chytriomyces sp. MP71]|nr:hypothetical protein BC830DRAFT_1142164 [Chytriomyces sp. MP71]